jgi:hypothetical protein
LVVSNHSDGKILKMKTYKPHVGMNETKRILMGLALAVAVIFLRHDTVAAADTTRPL